MFTAGLFLIHARLENKIVNIGRVAFAAQARTLMCIDRKLSQRANHTGAIEIPFVLQFGGLREDPVDRFIRVALFYFDQ